MVRLGLKLAPVEIGGCPYVVCCTPYAGNQLCFYLVVLLRFYGFLEIK